METAQNRILTKSEAADLLKVSVITLDRKRSEGLLPFHKIGDRIIFTAEDINVFLKNCEAPRIARGKIASVKKPAADQRRAAGVER